MVPFHAPMKVHPLPLPVPILPFNFRTFIIHIVYGYCVLIKSKVNNYFSHHDNYLKSFQYQFHTAYILRIHPIQTFPFYTLFLNPLFSE